MNESTLITDTFQLQRGKAPLLVSMPHVGTHIPPALRDAYVARALAVEDTDWHLQRLYNFLGNMGASVLTPHISRYVIDLNRPPDDAPMYPGAANTELCPTRFFTGDALYHAGREPDALERMRRRTLYWQPYHTALGEELQRLKAAHGFVLLWDAHSIRSHIPWLFEGRLPDLNIGTASGTSADPRICAAVMQACTTEASRTAVANGRFKGGFITRHYGCPEQQVHAIQLEMCQCLYMQEESPYHYDEALAMQIQSLLETMLVQALAATRACHA